MSPPSQRCYVMCKNYPPCAVGEKGKCPYNHNPPMREGLRSLEDMSDAMADRLAELWHSSIGGREWSRAMPPDGQQIWEFMGLSKDEYAAWAERSYPWDDGAWNHEDRLAYLSDHHHEVTIVSERTGSSSETDMTWHYVQVDGRTVSSHFFKLTAKFKAWRLRRGIW